MPLLRPRFKQEDVTQLVQGAVKDSVSKALQTDCFL
jgi:hypothetical protein